MTPYQRDLIRALIGIPTGVIIVSCLAVWIGVWKAIVTLKAKAK